ncbi:MAG: response regulator [Nitrospiraceae bacterium]|nr:response regulator [Nitrospiraceae bacterium]
MDKDGAFLQKLLATFKVEAAEHVSAISADLVALEKAAPNMRAGIIERVFRESHSMKGAARAVNLSTVETLCQSFEDVLSALKKQQVAPEAEIIDLLHRSVNILGGIISSVGAAGEKGRPERETIGFLLRDFEAIMKRAGEAGGKEACPDYPQSGREAPSGDVGAPFAGAGTIRVAKQRLDSILLQTEGLLSAKQAISQRAAELSGIMADAEQVKKDWARMRTELQALWKACPGKHSARVLPAPVKPVNDPMKGVMALFEKNGDRVLRLNDSLLSLGKALERDRRLVNAMVDGLMDEVKTVSMLPVSHVLELMPKLVRDLARDRGKDAELVLRGGEIEIDRRILDEMREPLIHLVRNCIDHGIEGPRERTAVNKPPAGAIIIEVAHKEGRAIEIAVSDDGAGVDIARVRTAAVRLGVISREEAERATEQKLLPLMFRSGVTTSPIITDISGRGLGLAIVQEKVEKLGGSVVCETSEGKGTTFRVLLPLTLATFRGVLVQAGDHRFIIPVTGIDCTVRVGRDKIRTVENMETITVDDRAIPYVALSAVLEMQLKGGVGDQEFVQAAVLGAGEHRIAFGIDEILHEQEVLVKDLGRQLARVRNVAGATVLGTGEVVPVLNVSGLLKSAVRVSRVAKAPSLPEETGAERKSVLVVEDSITARTLLKNILETAGYDVQTAVDGIDAFTSLKTGSFDIVVSDVDMPRMNGLDLTAKMRADKRFSELPVVLVTALESREDRERGIDVGADAYIVKSSFDQSNLIEVIRRLI